MDKKIQKKNLSVCIFNQRCLTGANGNGKFLVSIGTMSLDATNNVVGTLSLRNRPCKGSLISLAVGKSGAGVKVLHGAHFHYVMVGLPLKVDNSAWWNTHSVVSVLHAILPVNIHRVSADQVQAGHCRDEGRKTLHDHTAIGYW